MFWELIEQVLQYWKPELVEIIIHLADNKNLTQGEKYAHREHNRSSGATELQRVPYQRVLCSRPCQQSHQPFLVSSMLAPSLQTWAFPPTWLVFGYLFTIQIHTKFFISHWHWTACLWYVLPVKIPSPWPRQSRQQILVEIALHEDVLRIYMHRQGYTCTHQGLDGISWNL